VPDDFEEAWLADEQVLADWFQVAIAQTITLECLVVLFLPLTVSQLETAYSFD
jgi:hypothetical protein